MSYCTPHEVWKNLGKDSYVKVRTEIVGTASSTSSATYDFDYDNIISNSATIYKDSVEFTGSTVYDYDDGQITLATDSGSVITADYDYADLPTTIINQMIDSSDAMIDSVTGRTFGSSSTTEYLNVEPKQKTFFLRYYPILSLTSIQRNIGDETSPSWETLTAGLGNDYITSSADNEIGRVRFIDNYPYCGEDMIKVSYSYGYSSTPALVKELSILLTLRQLANSSVYKSMVKGYDGFTPVRTTEIENRIEELKKILRKQSINLV